MTTTPPTAAPPTAHRDLPPVLLLTEQPALLDDLLRLCAAAHAEAEVVHTGPVPAATWARAPLVLAGDDWTAWAATRTGRAGAAQPRRPGVLVVGQALDHPEVWAHGMAIGAEQVLRLPDDEARLTERIADAVEGPPEAGLTLGVIGGTGGAGASTLACALALTAARAGHRPVLIDVDPLGGGLDVPLAAEEMPGPRWPAFTDARGRLSGTALTEALPRPRGVSLLSWDRADDGGPDSEAMASVLSAAVRRSPLVILDLPRTLDDATTAALTRLDLALLLVPTDVRALAAARRTMDTAGALVRDLRLVARTSPRRSAITPAELAGLLGLPLAGELPRERGVTAACDAGRPPGGDPRGPLAVFSTRLLQRLLAPPGGEGSTAVVPSPRPAVPRSAPDEEQSA